MPSNRRCLRSWLSRLENVLNPLLYLNGTQSLIDRKGVNSLDRGFALVKEWSLDVLYNLNPRIPRLREVFLSNFLVAAKLGLRIDMHDGHFDVARSLSSIPCTTVSAHPALWIGRPFYSRYALPLFANFLRGAGDVRDAVEFLWCVHFTTLYTT